MTPMEGVLLACLPLMMIIGIAIGRRQRIPPTTADIARFMDRVVNQEEIAENERLTKFRMARNGRKTQRFDGGPNAKMLKLKVRPVARRFRK